MRYPGRSRLDREGDSGAWYGGRARIGTYLLINLYGLVLIERVEKGGKETEAEQGETRGDGAEDWRGSVFYREVLNRRKGR